MSDVNNISFDQIHNWIKTEKRKGRLMKEIVAELATRNDVTLLWVKNSSDIRHQQIVDAMLDNSINN